MIKPCPYEDSLIWRFGIDVGQNGVGLAAIEIDAAGVPLRILASVTSRIDGGILPGTEKSPVSRVAAAGQAHRVRRMLKRRKQRLRDLDQILTDFGYPVVDEAMTYEPWQARSRLVTEKIANSAELSRLVSISLRHIARHRGWRNPWLSWSSVAELQRPSSNHRKNLEGASSRLNQELGDLTVGQLGNLGTNKNSLIRPRTGKTGLRADGMVPLFEHKVLQEDHLEEIEWIWAFQSLPSEHLKPLINAVFQQTKPSVPEDRVGMDALPGMGDKQRAPRASLEFQEFRIRAAIGNLRIKESARSKNSRALSEAEYSHAYSLLATWHQEHPNDAPVWADVAAVLDISASLLAAPALDDVVGASAPYMRSLSAVRKKLNNLGALAKKPILKWMDQADSDQLAALVLWLADSTDAGLQALTDAGLDDIIADWDETALEKLSNTDDLESGRAAYSCESLRRLSQRMADDHCDLHSARRAEFGVDDNWRPPLPGITEQTGHPTVDQNLAVIRKFLMGAVHKWGVPSSVNVEHVRSAFMGPAALAEYRSEQRRITRQRDKARDDLKPNTDSPTDRDVRRYEYIQRQQSQCAYCGTTIDFRNAELDHVVPRSGGGATTRANLVAVCRECNHRKQNTPFAMWAAADKRVDAEGNKLVTLEETKLRIRHWFFGKDLRARREQRELLHRIGQLDHDEPIDERSMESTAYAARSVRERMESFFEQICRKSEYEVPKISVYRGSIISAARKSSGIDDQIRLRGKEFKDRGDFRHHAIDAATIALMEPSVSLTLAIRESMRRANRLGSDEPGWKEFAGRPGEAAVKYSDWKGRMQALADLLKEGIVQDRIAVTNPLRVNRNVGKVHEDTITPFSPLSVHGEWTLKDAKRLVDRKDFLAVKKALQGTKKPQSLPDELIEQFKAAGKTSLPAFSGAAAQIPVRGGGAKLGKIHHARIYAWKNKKNEIEHGILRVFAGEIAQMWPDKKTDILTAPIPEWSMSRRDVADKTEAALVSGVAVQVGWIAQGDEAVLDVSRLSSGPDKIANLLRLRPESRWTLDGFNSERNIKLRSLYLSQEGVQKGATDPLLIEMFERGIIISLSSLLPNCNIVRRDARGFIRRQGPLPHSFNPLEVAQELLG